MTVTKLKKGRHGLKKRGTNLRRYLRLAAKQESGR